MPDAASGTGLYWDLKDEVFLLTAAAGQVYAAFLQPG